MKERESVMDEGEAKDERNSVKIFISYELEQESIA